MSVINEHVSTIQTPFFEQKVSGKFLIDTSLHIYIGYEVKCGRVIDLINDSLGIYNAILEISTPVKD